MKVRYGETDQMGVVHHPNYLHYMEEARTAYLAHLGRPYGDLEREGIGLVVRKVELRYRAPAGYEDELAIDTRVEHVGGASVAFAYEVRRSGRPGSLVSGRVELACVALGPGGGRPRLLPDDVRALLESRLERDGPASRTSIRP